MTKSDELVAAVERDVDAYIKTLKDVDPGANNESYNRLHERLCSLIYEMRAAGKFAASTEVSSRSVRALPG